MRIRGHVSCSDGAASCAVVLTSAIGQPVAGSTTKIYCVLKKLRTNQTPTLLRHSEWHRSSGGSSEEQRVLETMSCQKTSQSL